MPNIIFKQEDVGCYADGASGHDHARKVILTLWLSVVDRAGRGLSIIKAPIQNEVLIEAIAGFHSTLDSLKGPMPDDAWDEEEAISLLQEVTEDGLAWGFNNGDFGLYPIESEKASYSDIVRDGMVE